MTGEKRKYSGPPKGSQEAKDRMAKVREAQYLKNGLVKTSNGEVKESAEADPTFSQAE